MAYEKRLIDANAFLSSMIKRFKCVPLIGRNDYDCESLKQMLIEAPTVDAVEVVHGRLERICEGRYLKYRCTACGGTALAINTETIDTARLTVSWAYCPNCGAKMDGDGNG